MCLCCSSARSERYSHLDSEEDDDDDETCDEDTSLELKQFSSVAHRFSKVGNDATCIHIVKMYSLQFIRYTHLVPVASRTA